MHPAPAIAGVPFRHQVAVPGAELRGIRTAGRAGLAPDRGIADRQCRVGHACRCSPQRVRVDIAAVDMEQFVIADVAEPRRRRVDPGIGARRIERQQQPPVPVYAARLRGWRKSRSSPETPCPGPFPSGHRAGPVIGQTRSTSRLRAQPRWFRRRCEGRDPDPVLPDVRSRTWSFSGRVRFRRCSSRVSSSRTCRQTLRHPG